MTRHGPHQEALKFATTIFPSRFASATFWSQSSLLVMT
uniref:Uncharacterized protein n=1 Tax=Arundo donax TaxID=35708 RepID=A0A0A9EQF6_ARUDO